MDGYVTKRIEKRVVNGEGVEIVTYQGEHSDEYLVREVRSGRCSLFHKGILQLRWNEVKGVKTGGFTLYEKGKVVRSEDWKELGKKERRSLGNCKNGVELIVEGDGVVYRGGFDDGRSMKREGRGMEFDEKNGRVLRCGVWENDKLFQIEKEFESDEVMIEYAIEDGLSNRSVLNRHPVYEGGYVFDEGKRVFLRHGYGCEIEGGVAVREGKWERGELKESVDLFDGWSIKMEGSGMFGWGRNVSIVMHNWNEWESVSKRVTELVIPSKCCNEAEWRVFDVSGLKWLKSIEIGDECFENVNEVKLIGLDRLERVVIGKNSFTKEGCDSNMNIMDANRHFHLKNCERLRELKIGSMSFSDYVTCEIKSVPSLEAIEIGEMNIWSDSCNFGYASLELKSDSE